MISVVHAFSRRNSGDSLLVDLTLRRLKAAGVARDTVQLLALDPSSFDDLDRVVGVPGEPWGRPSMAALRATAHLLASSVSLTTGMRVRLGTVAQTLAASDGVVAVGGGYLRTRGIVNSLGVALNHAPQLAIASRVRAPSIYLPQSIGPLHGPVGAAVKRVLSGLTAIHVRDDRSAAGLRYLGNVHRTPDLAVLELAERKPIVPDAVDGPPTLVARALPHAAGYRDRLRALADALPDHRWAVQAAGLGGRSDEAFYGQMGVTPSGPLRHALADSPAVIVSVRLHGALESLMAGRPAVHLSYERKGWGAYEDLGIGDFVHSARHFDPTKVAAQVSHIQADPGVFWEPLQRRLPDLAERSAALTEQLHTTFA